MRVGNYAHHDIDRAAHTGVPEVILAEGKRTDQIVGILQALHARGHGAIVSRPTAAQRSLIMRTGALPLIVEAGGRILRLEGPLGLDLDGSVVALVTAGTADVPVAEEARAILRAAGVRVLVEYDVGIAGIHRTIRALRRMERHDPAIYLVFAGREGALPTIVAGLVRAPVLGVPTSVGYGRGGRGQAALAAMLQACAPLAVVNIDGGVPAALFSLQLLSGQARSKRERLGGPPS